MAFMKKMFIVAALCASTALPAFALDVSDVQQMLNNKVDESIIINMVQSQKLSRPLTAQEVVMLNASGASPGLLEFLTRKESANQSYQASAPVTQYQAPTVVESSPTIIESSPTVITTQPNVVVTQPQTVYYTTPNYYVPPTYVYPYRYYSAPRPRYYSRPGVSFNFSFGKGGHRWNRSHHRPHRR